MPISSQPLPLVPRAPLIFTLAKWMQRLHIRGGHHLQRLARERGWLNVIIRYRLGPRVQLDVPLALRGYDEQRVVHYEREAITVVAELAARLPGPVTLLDCGADIGLISAHLVAVCPNVQHATAIEPNPDAFEYLARNASLLPVEAEAVHAAVSDFSGQAELRRSPADPSDHAAFIVPAEGGPIRVVRIDDLPLPKNHSLLLKADVEGEELAVMRGAAASLAQARAFVVIFEAHPGPVQRKGIDPLEVIKFLQAIRPCEVRVTELPEVALKLDQPFFAQCPPTRHYNICVAST